MNQNSGLNQNVVFRILIGLVVVAILAGLGSMVYRAGMTQGMLVGTLLSSAPATSADPASQVGRVAPWMGGYAPYSQFGHFGPPVFGFGCFGVLIPIILLFLFFGLMRGMFWRGRYGHWGPWGHHPGGWPGWGNQPGQPGEAGQPGQPGEAGQPVQAPPFFDEWHRRAHQADEAYEQQQPPQE